MTHHSEVAEPTEQKPAPPKSETVKRMLSRKNGATVDEIGAATEWQPHSVRAYLSGLRKRGSNVAREERGDGSKAYRLVKPTAIPGGNQ